MAFRNPNVVANVSKEEFDILKGKVEEIESNLEEIKKDIISNINTNTNSNVETNKEKYTLLNIDKIKNAKLGGAPRIDYFNFGSETKQNETVTNIEETNNVTNDILDQVNDLTSMIANNNVQVKEEPKIDNIDNNDFTKDIIDISEIIGNEKKYKIKGKDFQISVAKTSSGHRTHFVTDEQLQKLKSSYISDSKVITA